MGQLREWNELLARTVFGEEFEALLDEVKSEEQEGVLGKEVYRAWQGQSGTGHEEKLKRRIIRSADEADIEEYFVSAVEVSEGYKAGLIDATEAFFQSVRHSMELEENEALLWNKKALTEWETLGQRQLEAQQITGAAVRGAHEDELWEKSDIKLTHDMKERILNGAVRHEEVAEKQGVKIVRMSDSVQCDNLSIDGMLDEMTARLCDMMKKGADGIYW